MVNDIIREDIRMLLEAIFSEENVEAHKHAASIIATRYGFKITKDEKTDKYNVDDK